MCLGMWCDGRFDGVCEMAVLDDLEVLSGLHDSMVPISGMHSWSQISLSFVDNQY